MLSFVRLFRCLTSLTTLLESAEGRRMAVEVISRLNLQESMGPGRDLPIDRLNIEDVFVK